MASKTDICNLALVGMAETPILSIDDNVKSAQTLRAVWDVLRDHALRDHPWNFATARETLARLDETPPFGYAYAYQLPAENLRVLGMVSDGNNVDPTQEYKLEGGQLLTNAETAQVKYIKRMTDVSLWDAAFIFHFALKLALLTCKQITGLKPNQVELEIAISSLAGAKSVDGQEDTPEVQENNPWVEART